MCLRPHRFKELGNVIYSFIFHVAMKLGLILGNICRGQRQSKWMAHMNFWMETAEKKKKKTLKCIQMNLYVLFTLSTSKILVIDMLKYLAHIVHSHPTQHRWIISTDIIAIRAETCLSLTGLKATLLFFFCSYGNLMATCRNVVKQRSTTLKTFMYNAL